MLPPALRLRCLIVLACIVGLTASAGAQAPPAKRPLKHGDAASWRSLSSPQISRNGQFVGYAVMPQEGDGEYVVRNLKTGQECRLPTGGSRSQTAGTAPRSRTAPVRTSFVTGTRLAFTADNRLALMSVAPTKADIDNAQKDKKEPPQAGLVILELASGKQTRLEGVRTWTLPEDSGAFLAYVKAAKPEPAKPEPAKPEPAKAPENPPAPPMGTRPTRPATPQKVYGSELILRNLADKSERTFADVVEHSFTKDGKALVYTVSSKAEEKNGVYLAIPGNPAAPAALIAGKGRYQRLTWNEQQNQLVFLAR